MNNTTLHYYKLLFNVILHGDIDNWDSMEIEESLDIHHAVAQERFIEHFGIYKLNEYVSNGTLEKLAKDMLTSLQENNNAVVKNITNELKTQNLI